MAGPGVQQRDLDFLKDLCYVSALRGKDGTGICQGSSTRSHLSYDIYKTKYEASWAMWDVMNDDKYKKAEFFDTVVDNFFIGHCRAATIGNISDFNAHPFENKNLIGVHNGTLTDPEYRGKDKTDSELLLEDIGENGIIPVLSRLEKTSAYALVMINKNDRKIYVVRNRKRELFCCWNKKRAVMYWASEPEMIELCAARNGLEIGDIKYFIPEVVYSFMPSDVNSNRTPDWTTVSIFEEEKPKERKAALVIVKEEKKEESKNFMKNLVQKSKETQSSLKFVSTPKKQGLITHVPRRIPHTTCCGCGKDLSLVEQFFATKITDPKTNKEELMCTDCVDLSNRANFTEEEIRSLN